VLVDADEDLLRGRGREAGGGGRSTVSLGTLRSILRWSSVNLVFDSLAPSGGGARTLLPALRAGGGSGFWVDPVLERDLDPSALLGRLTSTQSGSSVISLL
jgi:hypothetical protein